MLFLLEDRDALVKSLYNIIDHIKYNKSIMPLHVGLDLKQHNFEAEVTLLTLI
jgi:hypothetical protein